MWVSDPEEEYLPCTRQEKYSAKQAIDAFFFRIGDVVAALLILAGTAMSLGASGFAKTNVALAAVWLGMAWIVGKRCSHRQTARPPRTAGVLTPVRTHPA